MNPSGAFDVVVATPLWFVVAVAFAGVLVGLLAQLASVLIYSVSRPKKGKKDTESERIKEMSSELTGLADRFNRSTKSATEVKNELRLGGKKRKVRPSKAVTDDGLTKSALSDLPEATLSENKTSSDRVLPAKHKPSGGTVFVGARKQK